MKFALGLFERPYGVAGLMSSVGSEEHRAVAREAVARSQTLLVNDGLLPLDPDAPLLLVGGRAADDIGMQSGGWTIEWQGGIGPLTEGTTILQGIRASVSTETSVLYERSGTFDLPDADAAPVCIGVVGELPYAEGLGDDGSLSLSPADIRLLERMADQCDRLAVILISGRPLIVTDLVGDWDALVAAWLPGTEGHGVADVLFGRQPFTGTLPYTWPRSIEQLPLGSAGGETEPLFPRGFGLGTG